MSAEAQALRAQIATMMNSLHRATTLLDAADMAKVGPTLLPDDDTYQADMDPALVAQLLDDAKAIVDQAAADLATVSATIATQVATLPTPIVKLPPT